MVQMMYMFILTMISVAHGKGVSVHLDMDININNDSMTEESAPKGKSCGFQDLLSPNTSSNESLRFGVRAGPNECSLDWKGTGHRPLIFIDNLIVPSAVKSITLWTKMKITCPGSSLTGFGQGLLTPSVYAQCVPDGLTGGLKICPKQHPQNTLYKIDNFICNSKIQSSLKPKLDSNGYWEICNGNSRMYQIGFDIPPLDPPFIHLIELCFDENQKTTKWARHTLRGQFIKGRVSNRNTPDFATLGFGDLAPGMYTIYSQKLQYQLFEKEIQATNILCRDGNSQVYLAKGHLAPKSDFVSKVEQDATYYFVNALPQWQVINNGNWGLIERRTQKYAEETGKDLEIATGGIGILKMSNVEILLGNFYIYDESSNVIDVDKTFTVPAPAATWKAIYDAHVADGVVFVVMNNPFDDTWSTMTTVESVCNTINCENIPWLLPPKTTIQQLKELLTNQVRGKTFCCTTTQFKSLYCPFAQTCKPF